jgi:CubicO group peptidase (beta-lactamase class C family)
MKFKSAFAVVAALWTLGAAQPPASYYPPRGEWERRQPAQVGLDAAQLERAMTFARSNETELPKEFAAFQEEQFGRLLGPIPRERGGTNAVVIRHGYIVAEFGDTSRVEPTYSVAKSYLATIAGLTVDRGLIRDVHEPVGRSVKDGGYDSPHNAKVTWHHHLQQTSEWEGTMWGKSHDFLDAVEFGAGQRKPRTLNEPGTYYEYNDVRINRMSLSLLRLWRKSLPEVLEDEVMDPIGASDTWRYRGYANSEVEIDGKRMPSVSGGTRWGGGLWISTLDHARFGYLMLRKGRWKDRQILSDKWLRQATMRGTVGPDYGYLWWLNTQRKAWPSAPASSFAALGFGSNTIWVDPEHELVVVWRWHRGSAFDEFVKQLLAAVNGT